MTFTAVSDNPKVQVTAYSEYLVLEFNKVNVGDVITITITADDGKGGTVSADWIITITPFEP